MADAAGRTYAALLATGVDISIVQKLLGHSSVSVTADIYAHMLKGVGQQAVHGVANLIAHVQLTKAYDSGSWVFCRRRS